MFFRGFSCDTPISQHDKDWFVCSAIITVVQFINNVSSCYFERFEHSSGSNNEVSK